MQRLRGILHGNHYRSACIDTDSRTVRYRMTDFRGIAERYATFFVDKFVDNVDKSSEYGDTTYSFRTILRN